MLNTLGTSSLRRGRTDSDDVVEPEVLAPVSVSELAEVVLVLVLVLTRRGTTL
jgi:hypothetical protein